MAGGESQQLTKSQTSIQQFAWKPDGTAIAFAAADAPPKKTGADKFDDAFEVGNGSFLDKDKALPTHLWLIPAAGGEAKRLTSGAWTLARCFSSRTSGIAHRLYARWQQARLRAS